MASSQVCTTSPSCTHEQQRLEGVEATLTAVPDFTLCHPAWTDWLILFLWHAMPDCVAAGGGSLGRWLTAGLHLLTRGGNMQAAGLASYTICDAAFGSAEALALTQLQP